MRLVVLARMLPLLSLFANPGPRGHHEQRQVIARLENIVTEAQSILPPLTPEVEAVNRVAAARREQVNRVPVALGFEELPESLHFHESRRLFFQLLDALIERQRLLVMVGEV